MTIIEIIRASNIDGGNKAWLLRIIYKIGYGKSYNHIMSYLDKANNADIDKQILYNIELREKLEKDGVDTNTI